MCNSPTSLTSLVDAEVEWSGITPSIHTLQKRLDEGNRVFGSYSLVALSGILTSSATKLILAPGLSASSEKLGEVASFNAAPQCLALRIVERDVQRAEAHTAKSNLVSWALSFASSGASIAGLVSAVLCPTTIYVAADAWCWAGEAFEIVVFEMCVHVSEANNLVAEMAFGRTAAIGELMWSEARQKKLCARRFIWITLLWDLKVTEAAKNELTRASCRFVLGERGH
jgi:hypothetical protein